MSKTNKVSSFIVLAGACIALGFGVVGCMTNDVQAGGAQSQPAQTDQSQDPSAANLAPTDGTQANASNAQQQPVSQPQQQNYQQPASQPQRQYYRQPAPVQQQSSPDQTYADNDYD